MLNEIAALMVFGSMGLAAGSGVGLIRLAMANNRLTDKLEKCGSELDATVQRAVYWEGEYAKSCGQNGMGHAIPPSMHHAKPGFPNEHVANLIADPGIVFDDLPMDDGHAFVGNVADIIKLVIAGSDGVDDNPRWSSVEMDGEQTHQLIDALMRAELKRREL